MTSTSLRKTTMKYIASIFFLSLFLLTACKSNVEITKNVLLIVSDDLRPALACYGNELVQTPHLDDLSSRSVLFTTAAAQQALCAPSRTSFLTSRRPDTTKIFANKGTFYWRDKGNYTTLPQYFKQSGYVTASVGKVFHHGQARKYDYPYSWSLPAYIPSTLKYENTKVCPNDDGTLHTNIFCPVDLAKQPEGTLPDIQNIQSALSLLKNFSSQPEASKKPFFLAVGLYKPHIPLKFPKEFLDLYPLHEIPLAPDPELPAHLPPVAYEPWTDLRWRDDVAAMNLSFPYGPMPDQYAKKIRQGYYAATSYIDSLIGDLLKGVDRYGFRKNTVIAVIGDHGWALGEHDEWCKYSNFRVATNVPLIVHVPNLTDTTATQGIVSSALVELVDLMPSLVEICGLPKVDRCPKDSSSVITCTEGLSFYPLLTDPTREWKKAIFSQYPRPTDRPAMNTCPLFQPDIAIMGYSMQTLSGYRFTEWIDYDIKTFKANWLNIIARELYLNEKEDINVANLPEFQFLVKSLSKQLRDGWIGALPTNFMDTWTNGWMDGNRDVTNRFFS